MRISTWVLSAPPLKIGASRLAPKLQTGLSRSSSTNRSLEIELTPVVSAMAGRRAAFASPIAVERGRDAAFGGDHVGTALEERRWQPARHGAGLPWQLRRSTAAARRRIPAEQELERSKRLFRRQLELPERIAIGPDARPARRTRLPRLPTPIATRSPARLTSASLARMARAPPPPAARPRSPGTSSWPPARQSTDGRIRNRPAPTAASAAAQPPGRIAPAPRDRAPSSS